MKHLYIPFSLIGASLLLFIWSCVFQLKELPPTVAIHFGFSGLPDRWVSKEKMFWIMGSFLIGFPGILLLLFSISHLLPDWAINLPRKERWLDPDHRNQTFEFLNQTGVWLAAITAVFLVTLRLLVVDANFHAPPSLSKLVWISSAIYMGFCVLWSFVIIRRFR